LTNQNTSLIIETEQIETMSEVETFIIPMTENTKERDIFKVGKHSIKLAHNDTIVEWEITPEARNALLELHTIKPNI